MAGLQQLENKVAQLLKRPAHRIVVYDNSGINGPCDPRETIVQIASTYPRWKKTTAWTHLDLGYHGNWPTYWQLKSAGKIDLYLWQWGVLWNSTPRLRELMGVPRDTSIEVYIAERVEHVKAQEQARLSAAISKMEESRSVAKQQGWLSEWDEHLCQMMAIDGPDSELGAVWQAHRELEFGIGHVLPEF